MLLPLVLMLFASDSFAQSTLPPTNSADASKTSAIPAANDRSISCSQIISACAHTADELDAQRKLTAALETENAALRERLATESRSVRLLAELDETRRRENEALRTALAAKDDAIAARDAVIRSQEKLAEALRARKPSAWKQITGILIGAAVVAVLK